MKLSAALLFLPAIQAGKETVDISGSLDTTSGTCLNAVYSKTHPELTLQCLSTSRFWSKISAEANGECVEGRYLTIKNLKFESTFDWMAYDFSIYVSSSYEFDNATSLEWQNPYLMALYGDECLVHSMGREDGVDADGDTCFDMLPISGSLSAIITIPELQVPCSGGGGSVQLQFCSTWRGEAENAHCDVNGPSPCSFDECACEVVDLGVKIVKPEDAKPTCEPSKVMLSNVPTAVEAPTAPNGQPAAVTPAPFASFTDDIVWDTPAPSIGEDTVPTPSPFVITVTSSPVSWDTPSPTQAGGSDDANDDGTVDDMAGSDDAATDDKVSTCKNNAVMSSVSSEGSAEITTQATHGVCAMLTSSTMIYYPKPNYLGMDSCAYTLCVQSMESGEMVCSEGTLEVNVVECPVWKDSPTESPGDVPTLSPTCDYSVSLLCCTK
jgi:hypothetical protein